MNSLNEFYNKYKNFNLIEYKKLNKKYDIQNNSKIIHDFFNSPKNDILISIKDFFNKYPDFDIFFYKLFYPNLILNNNIDYLIHYHTIGITNNYYYSLNNFIKKYDIDFIFLKNFYNIFHDKDHIEICKILEEDNNYIYSNKSFIEKFPTFNIHTYKLFNKNIRLNNDIKYKSNWFHNKTNNNIFDNLLYKIIYNVDQIHEICNIYTLDDLVKYLDDFNFVFFKKKYPITVDYNKLEIIEYYINNINKIKFIYSEKFFYLKYPNFKIEEYKKLNNLNNTNYQNINILNEYYFKNKNNDTLISINDFLIKNQNFNLNLYKNIFYFKTGNILDNDNEYIYNYYNNKDKINISHFNIQYPNFNLNLYKYFGDNMLKNLDNTSILYYFKIKRNNDAIYSVETFHKKYPKFNFKLYRLFNNLIHYKDDELIIHFHSIGIHLKLICNEEMINNFHFNIDIYKGLNKDLTHLSNEELIFHWYKYGKYQDRIYSIETFNDKYQMNIKNAHQIVEWMNVGVYKDKKIIGRDTINNIYEALIDLSHPYPKNKLTNGISLIIRAKNEEKNLNFCIDSVVDLVDEIIFVDNNSTDNTYNIMKKYAEKYNNIKLYRYNINVAKVGIEHNKSIKNNDKNTLGTFYNWCLSKATKFNIFKWDADFICIRNNFVQLVNKFKLSSRDDKFCIWFTGKTLFENNNNFYINYGSFYNEFRIFSYKNNFCWYDGNICEYTEPYLNSCLENKKFRYKYPLFYEVKRTSLDEFKERSSLIDNRDIKDFHIINNLKENNESNLININTNIINSNIKIILCTPSLNFGGGNQFIINMYKIYKSLGFIVLIVPMNNENIKNTIIEEEDIYNFKLFNIDFIKKKSPNFIFFNSSIPFNVNEIKMISNMTKIFFITHSDLAFANSFIKNFHTYFYKIITVNDYTISKLCELLKINSSKFFKIINYSDIITNNTSINSSINTNINTSINTKINSSINTKINTSINTKINTSITIKKINKKFGIISRFSEDKNIPMLILSLIDVFKKYKDYKIYLVGTDNYNYDNYLIKLVKKHSLENNIFFEGYQSDVVKYYEMFDFIILPSVSEGCSYNIIESMKFGIPVITSNVGGNHELIKNNVNGILYDYTDIRVIENTNIFIQDYNEHLSAIGYFINNENLKKYYSIKNYDSKISAIIPFDLSCNQHNEDKNMNCECCNKINSKINIFNSNLKNITNSIINMIEMNKEKITEIKNNNIDFIEKNFNQNIYINQLLTLIV